MQLTTLDLVVVVVYMALLSGIGIYFSRRQTSREEYLLGGRSMHWMLLGGSMMATLLSTITFLSVPGEMMRYGIAYLSGIIAMPLFVPVANRVLIPVLRRLPITSVYEYLEKRFDVSFRSLASFLFVLRTIIWMGLIIYTCSFAVAQITGWDLYFTIIATGLVTTFYTTAGGLRTVVWTDNLQLMILLGGALAIPVLIGFSLGSGPATWWQTFSEAGRTEIQTFSWDLTVRITVVGIVMGNFFWNICTLGGDQVAVQRYLSCPDLSAARKSVWMFAGFNFAVMLALLFCGLSLFAFYASQSSAPVQAFQEEIAARADRVMPIFIVEELPAGVSGLLLAALAGGRHVQLEFRNQLHLGSGGLRLLSAIRPLQGPGEDPVGRPGGVAAGGSGWNRHRNRHRCDGNPHRLEPGRAHRTAEPYFRGAPGGAVLRRHPVSPRGQAGRLAGFPGRDAGQPLHLFREGVVRHGKESLLRLGGSSAVSGRVGPGGAAGLLLSPAAQDIRAGPDFEEGEWRVKCEV